MKGTNIELTDAIKAYVEKKVLSLEKLCERFDPCDVAVELGRSSEHHQKGYVYFAEFNVSVRGGFVRTSQVGEDLYACIDRAKDDLRRQFVDRKERLTAIR